MPETKSATSTQNERCLQDSPKGEENDESIGASTESTQQANRTTRSPNGVGHLCTCGRVFKSQRGMKIHRTKKKCGAADRMTQERTDLSDKSLEDTSQAANHSAVDFHIETFDKQPLKLIEEKRPRILFPQAKSDEWNDLDRELAKLIRKKTSKLPLEKRMEIFTDTIYFHCKEKFGVKVHVEKPKPKPNRRQQEMEDIRKRKNQIRKQMKTASEIEKVALQEIWKQLRTRHSALSKAERTRRKRYETRKNRQSFFKDPFKYAKALFESPRSGVLSIDQERLESHLRDTYSDPKRVEDLSTDVGLVWPSAPGASINTKAPSVDELQKVVAKARSKSAPGPNGIPYLLYKKCPKVLRLLHALLDEHWTKGIVSDQWNRANGVYIPKEKDSKDIGQFRPISLLNVEGKMFFATMANRLTSYLIENGYVDTSVQKGGVPGVPGCLEHASMIWEAIQRAKKGRLDLHVIWLDLANAYGSVPHSLLWLALKMYHIPDHITDLLKDYFETFRMRFSTKDYETSWIELETGIAMGCTVSPILFVLAMQILLKASEQQSEGAHLGDGVLMAPLKAFMDDTTVLTSSQTEAERMLGRLNQLVSWCRMAFKPKKSRSLSLRKGKVSDEIHFNLGDQTIPTVSEIPVKSLGRWYDATLRDSRRKNELHEQVASGLQIIDRCGLSGKFKVWILQFMLIPKLLWPLLVYEIPTSAVEKLETKINRHIRKWLGLPPCLTTVALTCKKSKLKLPLKSLTEEYKVGKARLHLMFRESEDGAVRNMEPELRTGRKWKVKEAVAAAESALKVKDVIGITQSDRKGLGHQEMSLWSTAGSKEKRDMILAEIRQCEDDKRIQTAAQQGLQGQWLNWETALQKSLTWNDIWHTPPMSLGFSIRAAYDVLPTRANLVRWSKEKDEKCPLCQGKQTLQHILSGCKVALAKGRYTWRHNKVLEVLASVAVEAASSPRKTKRSLKTFTSGEKTTKIPCNIETPGMLDNVTNWEIAADLQDWEEEYPDIIKQSGQRPDLVISSNDPLTCILVELTVPYETNMEAQHEYKIAKYQELLQTLRTNGIKASLFAVEVGARGFVGSTMYSLLKKLNISGKKIRGCIKDLAEAAEKSSQWIWNMRNEN